MDPVTALGAAGSVVGIAGFGIQLSQILHKYLSQIWFAQESLEAIVEEIWMTTTALQEIYVFLKQEVTNINRGQPRYIFTENSLEKVKVTADKCLVIFWRVEATISGNWPEGIEELLVRRLIEFNNKLCQYTPDSPIKIESELTADPLGLRDKLRWPSKASKLDKYCKQLQRYQDSLVLLLQVVSLGQQRLKPNPTEEDVRLMLKTYAIINRIASPEKLRIIALETQTQSQYRHGNAGREPSVAPGQNKRPQTPSRAAANNTRITRVPTNSGLHTFGTVRTKNHSVSHPIAMKTSRARSPQSAVPQPANRALINGHTNTLDVDAANEPSSPSPASQVQKPQVPLSSSTDGTTQHEDDLMRSKMDGTGSKTPPPQARVNGVVPDAHAADTEQATQKAPEGPYRGASLDTQVEITDHIEGRSLFSPSAPIRTLQDSSQNATQSIAQPQRRGNLEESDAANVLVSEKITKQDTSKIEVQILPYVLYEGGAYQLPVSLELELKSKLQGSLNSERSGKELTERLAFLSPGQVQTLQNLLRYNSGDQFRKLAHLEVVKKSSVKFWQKSAKVMVAFVEGERSGMPESISLVVTNSTGTATPRLPQNTAFSVPQQQTPSLGSSSQLNNDSNLGPPDAERSRTGRVELTSSPRVGRQDVIAHIPSAAPTSVQPRGQPNSLNITGISRIQDVTPLLVEEGGWRKRFTEYKVWTIRPFLSIDQTQTPDDAWDRCVISEEHLNINEIRRRLATLDKSSMTVLEKMTTLAVSQQIQVQQSLEAAKSGASDSAYQWKFRQLDIIQSKRWFRPKHVKKVVVYVSVEPPLQAFKQYKESQRQHIEAKEDASSLPNNNDGRSSFAGRQELSIDDKKKKKRSRVISDTDIEDAVSSENSDGSIGIHKGENDSREWEWVRKKERKFSHRSEPEDLRRREVERANEAIASRPPVPMLSRGRSPQPSSAHAGTRSPIRLPSPRLASPMRYYHMNRRDKSRRGSASTDESNSSDSNRYQVRYEYPHAIVITGREPTKDNANDHRRPVDGEDRHTAQVRERGREAELGEKMHRRRRAVEAQRDRTSPISNHFSADRNSDLWLRRPSLSRSSYSTRPGHGSRSEVTSRPGPHLLGYYTDEELRARTRARQSYPDEFDRQPYDPYLSPQAVEARQEAIEQLLLEWTPLYSAENGSDDDDASPAETPAHEAPNGPPHSSIEAGEEPEAPHYVPRPKDDTLPPPEIKVDTQLEMLSESQAQETEALKGSTPRARTNWTSRLATSQLVSGRLQRRETTDGVGLEKPFNGQLSNASRPQTADGNDDDDTAIRPLQKGDRAATLPNPAPQAWTDIGWARQIVEETATVADPDEDEPPLRNTRRRTVEFEGLTDHHHLASRGQSRDPKATVERRDHVSGPRQQRKSQTRVRDRDPHIETNAEHDGHYRSRSREDRHSSRREKGA